MSNTIAAGMKPPVEEMKVQPEAPPLKTQVVEAAAPDELPEPPEVVEPKPTAAPEASPVTVAEAAEKVTVAAVVETPTTQVVQEAPTAPPAIPDENETETPTSNEKLGSPTGELNRQESGNDMQSGRRSRRKRGSRRSNSFRF